LAGGGADVVDLQQLKGSPAKSVGTLAVQLGLAFREPLSGTLPVLQGSLGVAERIADACGLSLKACGVKDANIHKPLQFVNLRLGRNGNVKTLSAKVDGDVDRSVAERSQLPLKLLGVEAGFLKGIGCFLDWILEFYARFL